MGEKNNYTVTLYVVNVQAESPEGAAAIAMTLIPQHEVGYLLPEPHVENEVVVEWTDQNGGGHKKVTVAVHHSLPTATITCTDF